MMQSTPRDKKMLKLLQRKSNKQNLQFKRIPLKERINETSEKEDDRNARPKSNFSKTSEGLSPRVKRNYYRSPNLELLGRRTKNYKNPSPWYQVLATKRAKDSREHMLNNLNDIDKRLKRFFTISKLTNFENSGKHLKIKTKPQRPFNHQILVNRLNRDKNSQKNFSQDLNHLKNEPLKMSTKSNNVARSLQVSRRETSTSISNPRSYFDECVDEVSRSNKSNNKTRIKKISRGSSLSSNNEKRQRSSLNEERRTYSHNYNLKIQDIALGITEKNLKEEKNGYRLLINNQDKKSDSSISQNCLKHNCNPPLAKSPNFSIPVVDLTDEDNTSVAKPSNPKDNSITRLKNTITTATTKQRFKTQRILNKKKSKEKKNENFENEANLDNKCFTAYSAQTHKGLVRDYNEDRVCMILNIFKANNCKLDASSSYFALFDGHAGSHCANFLRDKLHYFLTVGSGFEIDKAEALKKAIAQAEEEFTKNARKLAKPDKSGSCALVALFNNSQCYICNVGDSRAVTSRSGGLEIKSVTRDHKPEMEWEKERILQAGGNIFRKQVQIQSKNSNEGSKPEIVTHYGPYRVQPGGLSVSRTIGDIPSKDVDLGGNPGCVVATPDIFTLSIGVDDDFLVLGCDGVFDCLSNEEVINSVWKVIAEQVHRCTMKDLARHAAEYVIKKSFDAKSTDNITVIVIFFQEKNYYEQRCRKIVENHDQSNFKEKCKKKKN